jgi:hypothetical protein
LGTRQKKIDTSNIGHKTQKDRHACAQCNTCLSVCVLCPMLPVSIFLCHVPNATRVNLSVSCAQCCPCLSFCVLCPMLLVSIFFCLVPNVTRVYLSLSCARQSNSQEKKGTRQGKIETCNIGYKTQKDRHDNIGHKTKNGTHG